MIRRRYTIEASMPTLKKFTKIAGGFWPTASFLEKLTLSKGEEYYYLTLLAEDEVHRQLRVFGFQNSHIVAERL